MTFTHIITNNPIPEMKRTTVNGIRQYQTPEGNVYPSVTTVLSKADKSKNIALNKWRQNVGIDEAKKITQKSAARGTGLHKSIEKYLNNDSEYNKGWMPNVKEMFQSVKPYLDFIDNIHYQEKGLYSDRMKLAGTVDCIAEYNGVLSCIDFKNARSKRTEKMIWTYFLQCTAYSLFFNEWCGLPLIKQLVIIMAVENDEPQIFIKPIMDYVEPLLKVVKNYHKM